MPLFFAAGSMEQAVQNGGDDASRREMFSLALDHARRALEAIDQAEPSSMAGVRCQHLIDELKAALTN